MPVYIDGVSNCDPTPGWKGITVCLILKKFVLVFVSCLNYHVERRHIHVHSYTVRWCYQSVNFLKSTQKQPITRTLG